MHFYAATCIDFYKSGHRKQYPEGTELVVSNLTPRSGKYANVEDKKGIIFFGLQYFMKDFLIEIWNKSFFNLPKEKVVEWYKRRMDNSLGVDSIPVDHIEALHDLGYLPIEIKAVPEGTFVPVGVPCMTIENNKPEFFWLTNYLETIWSSYMFLPCTSATTAHAYKNLLVEYAEKTGGSKEFCDFQAHDFSFRGMVPQAAVMSGAGHLLSFKGTDTVPAIDFLERYYNADCTKELIGYSVPATEHSVMSMDGETGELETFQRLINKIYPKGIVSIVSDTWDFWKVISDYSVQLKSDILARDGKVVFRPDSGNPADILCGTAKTIFDISELDNFIYVGDIDPWIRYKGKYLTTKETPNGVSWVEVPTPLEAKGAVETLWDIFGGTINAKGYKELDSHVGLIYGDSITYDVAKDILQRLEAKGFASTNVVFGIGSYTYQYVTRDTWGWAVKATYGVVNGEPRNIFKKPKTDTGEKNSAKGLLRVTVQADGNLALVQESSVALFNSKLNALQPVFRDGKILREETLAGIRERLWK